MVVSGVLLSVICGLVFANKTNMKAIATIGINNGKNIGVAHASRKENMTANSPGRQEDKLRSLIWFCICGDMCWDLASPSIVSTSSNAHKVR